MKVFSATYGGGHVTIANAMHRVFLGNNIDYEILALTAAAPFLRNAGTPHKTPLDYAFLFDDWDEIIKTGERFAKGHHNPESGIPYEETVVYFGIGMSDLIKEKGEEEAMRLFEEKERMAFLPVNSMKKILEYEKPDYLQITCGVRSEFAAAIAANTLGIVTYQIMDGPWHPSRKEIQYYFYLNEATAQEAHEFDVDKNKIFVTGNPAFDNYHSLNKQTERQKAMEQLGINDNPIVLWLVDICFNEVVSDSYKHFYKLAKAHPNLNFIVKCHPTSNNISDFLSVYDEPLPSNFRIIKEYNAPSIIKAADVAITYRSTTGLEAHLLETPLIVPKLYGDITRYEKHGAALLITNLSELEGAIKKCLYDKEVLAALAKGRAYHVSAKNAGQNIVNVLRQIKSGTVLHNQ